MAWTKKVFKNEGEATASDPRIDAKFLNDLQDEIVLIQNADTVVEVSSNINIEGKSLSISRSSLNKYKSINVHIYHTTYGTFMGIVNIPIQTNSSTGALSGRTLGTLSSATNDYIIDLVLKPNGNNLDITLLQMFRETRETGARGEFVKPSIRIIEGLY